MPHRKVLLLQREGLGAEDERFLIGVSGLPNLAAHQLEGTPRAAHFPERVVQTLPRLAEADHHDRIEVKNAGADRHPFIKKRLLAVDGEERRHFN
jgi:hypothetical protein